MKISKHFYIGILLLTSISCASQSGLTESKANVIESIITDSKYGVYNRTFSNEDLNQLDIKLEDLNFWNPCKYKLERENGLLSDKEISFINKQFKNLESVSIESNSPNLKFQKDSENTRLSFISLPILFRNDNYAVYYSMQRYGGQINLLKKENNKWTKYCSYLVWIE